MEQGWAEDLPITSVYLRQIQLKTENRNQNQIFKQFKYWQRSMNILNRLQQSDSNCAETDIQQLHQQQPANQRSLNNFTLGKKIGAGTFSQVCIAKHRTTNQQVAIKIISKAKIEDESDKRRLDREIKIMRKILHPNIVQLYEIIETKKYIYLVMEYAARGQLFEHIVSQQKLTQFEASKILLQLVDGIQYLHKIGVAHRDLKPENLLLDHKLNIKITDFGLSNIYASDQLLTTACGSPSYACPQMLSNRPYDGLKADIWSIGVVLYAMCFGYLPFDNVNTSELYNLIKQGQYEIPDFASPNLIDILTKILQIRPQHRATIAEIRAHPFCRQISQRKLSPCPGIIISLSEIPFQSKLEEEMRVDLKLDTAHLREEIIKNKHNENTCTYYLLLRRSLRTSNVSLGAYYQSKYNLINRYAIIERVKATLDKKNIERMEVRKFKAVREYIEGRNSMDYDCRRSMSPRAILKADYINKQFVKTHKFEAIARRHFAPSNTRTSTRKQQKKSKTSSKKKNQAKSLKKLKTSPKMEKTPKGISNGVKLKF